MYDVGRVLTSRSGHGWQGANGSQIGPLLTGGGGGGGRCSCGLKATTLQIHSAMKSKLRNNQNRLETTRFD